MHVNSTNGYMGIVYMHISYVYLRNYYSLKFCILAILQTALAKFIKFSDGHAGNLESAEIFVELTWNDPTAK